MLSHATFQVKHVVRYESFDAKISCKISGIRSRKLIAKGSRVKLKILRCIRNFALLPFMFDDTFSSFLVFIAKKTTADV